MALSVQSWRYRANSCLVWLRIVGGILFVVMDILCSKAYTQTQGTYVNSLYGLRDPGMEANVHRVHQEEKPE